MKTYQLKHQLKRVSHKATIHFENVIYQHTWYIFNPYQIAETLIFNADKTLLITSKKRITHGVWDYHKGDAFDFHIDGVCYVLHLVHLDNNLIIFELQDTKQYFILLSYQAIYTLNLTSLDSIEYYIKKLQLQVREQVEKPTYTTTTTNHIIPILVMGGLQGLDFWHHDSDEDTSNPSKDKPEKDEIDDEFEEWYEDENFMLDETEDNELECEDSLYDTFDEESALQGTEYEDDNYNEYGDLTEEEVIYDYLQNEEMDEDL